MRERLKKIGLEAPNPEGYQRGPFGQAFDMGKRMATEAILAAVPDWLTIDAAPLDIEGHVWSPEMPHRLDAPGTVRISAAGGRIVTSPWKGIKFTHWHPFPASAPQVTA